jgi:uncharacterized protein (DUF924 family)
MVNTGSGTAADVNAFWLAAGPDRWYRKDEAFDREVRERFADLHAEAAAGRLHSWSSSPEGTLALVILLDQFSRNMFRGARDMFAHDQKALAIARQGVAAGFDNRVDPVLRQFFYMPFMHSESIVDQERCVALCHGLPTDTLRYAREHERIIRRFGRFPHRNRLLGRHTSPAERTFLDGGGFAG